MPKDIHGRPYALVSEVKAGTMIQVDGDFTCIEKGTCLIVQDNGRGLFVPCAGDGGGHHLIGQLSDDGAYYVGMYLV